MNIKEDLLNLHNDAWDLRERLLHNKAEAPPGEPVMILNDVIQMLSDLLDEQY